MNWPTVKFETLYSEPSKNGLYKSQEFHGDGTRIINMGELFAYPFLGNQGMRLVRLNESELVRYSLSPGDLLFARRSLIEEGAGKCVLVVAHDTPMVFESSIIRVRLNSVECDPRFYFYYFRSPVGRPIIQSIITGVAQKGIRGGELKNIIVHHPPFPTQRRIASILSAYDDLIENNARRIALLEESMRLLYREWFVRLRFSGHERVKVVDGLPEGWKRTIIDQAFDVLGGGTPSKAVDEYWQDGTINWYTPTDLTKAQTMFAEESLSKINDVGLANSSARMFPPRSVMMTSRATIGAIAINTTDACTNQGFITCLPNKRVPVYFLYHWLKDNVDVFISHATGATFKEITKGVFRQLPINLPEPRVLKEFEDAVKPMAECVLNLQRQNQRLIEARDLLLPRLMSGEI